MKTAVIYHWWGYKTDAPPIANLRSPIITSIATLRGVNANIPIYVIDVSNDKQDWMDYPRHLNFTVIEQPAFLKKNYSHRVGYQNLSRLFDINRVQYDFPEDVLIYCDSDVFFLKDPLPLHQNSDLFCFNKYNSGFYYYNKQSENCKKFFEIFEAYALTALNDESFRYITKQFDDPKDYFVLDETLMYYMYVKHRDLFGVVDAQEHFITSMAQGGYEYKTESIKMYHGNGTFVINPYAKSQYEEKYARGLMCLGIYELYKNLKRALSVEDIEKMYSELERRNFLAKQVSFNEDFLKKIVATKKESGHFYFTEAIGIV